MCCCSQTTQETTKRSGRVEASIMNQTSGREPRECECERETFFAFSSERKEKHCKNAIAVHSWETQSSPVVIWLRTRVGPGRRASIPFLPADRSSAAAAAADGASRGTSRWASSATVRQRDRRRSERQCDSGVLLATRAGDSATGGSQADATHLVHGCTPASLRQRRRLRRLLLLRRLLRLLRRRLDRRGCEVRRRRRRRACGGRCTEGCCWDLVLVRV